FFCSPASSDRHWLPGSRGPSFSALTFGSSHTITWCPLYPTLLPSLPASTLRARHTGVISRLPIVLLCLSCATVVLTSWLCAPDENPRICTQIFPRSSHTSISSLTTRSSV